MEDKMQQMLNCALTDNLTINDNTWTINPTQTDYSQSAWGFWERYYYPQVIHSSYPIYIQERAKDKGKEAFEIIKMLQDKRFIKLEKVSDFIDCMDALIKIL